MLPPPRCCKKCGRRPTAEVVFPRSACAMMSSRVDFTHLDFITGGWNMLCYHSFYLLREMEDSRRIQLSRGLSSIFFSSFGGGDLTRASPFPSCSPSKPAFMPAFASELLCVYGIGLLVGTKGLQLQVSLTYTIPLPRSFSPSFTLLRKFLLPLPCPLDARVSQSSPCLAPRTEST